MSASLYGGVSGRRSALTSTSYQLFPQHLTQASSAFNVIAKNVSSCKSICDKMKTMVDSPKFAEALFAEFGDQADLHPAVLAMESALVRYVTVPHPQQASVFEVNSELRIVHVPVVRAGQPYHLLVTISETEIELVRLGFLLVPVATALAA